MKLAEFSALAKLNLETTYLRFGLATPNASLLKRPGLRGCIGEFDHPLGNFALADRLTLDDVAFVRELGQSRLQFHQYVLPGPESDSAAEMLIRAGFRELSVLICLVGPSAPEQTQESPLDLELAEGPAEALEIGTFMASLFFSDQPAKSRAVIADATANAADCELYFLNQNGGQCDAALMLSRVDSSLGIYNLCVRPTLRGRGLGRSLIEWALQTAHLEGRLATLQCHPRLVPWYESMGFWQSGLVRPFSLERAYARR
jgi:GNAT superfamily N-acetyltransferase